MSSVNLDVKIKLKDGTVAVLTEAYFLGSIVSSLQSLFGEIGGLVNFEVISFDTFEKRGVLRVPIDCVTKTKAAITLIGYFQDIPCHFQVTESSQYQKINA